MNKEKLFKFAKGFYGKAKNCRKAANMRVEKALQHSYKDRKIKKRDMRALWIQQINAATREHGVNYSRFINHLKVTDIHLDRKILSDLAQNEPYSFKAVFEVATRHAQNTGQVIN